MPCISIISAILYLKWLVCFYVVFFREIILSDVLVVLCNLLVVGSSDFGRLVPQQLDGLRPLAARNRCLDCLLELPGFNEMVDCAFRLLVIHEVLSPTLLQTDDYLRVLALRELDCLLVGVPLAVAVQRLLVVLHLLVEFTGFLEHPRGGQSTRNFLKKVLGKTHVVVEDHVRSLRREAAFEVQVDRIDEVPFRLFQLSRFLLLAGLHQPGEVVIL